MATTPKTKLEILEQDIVNKQDEILTNTVRIEFHEFLAGKSTDPQKRAKHLVDRDSIKATIKQLEQGLELMKEFVELNKGGIPYEIKKN